MKVKQLISILLMLIHTFKDFTLYIRYYYLFIFFSLLWKSKYVITKFFSSKFSSPVKESSTKLNFNSF